MHELSVARSLVDVVLGQLERSPYGPACRVSAVRVKVGAMSAVVPEALASAFPAAASGTPLDGARLDLERVPLVAWCPSCAEERTLPSVQRLRCPTCGTPTPRIIHGRELEVVSVEVVPDATAHPPTASTEARHAV